MFITHPVPSATEESEKYYQISLANQQKAGNDIVNYMESTSTVSLIALAHNRQE
ncbi:AAEL006088-PA [Aedes aegypti]|uniref:AAEL006088-PA n=1 Tax=Aedes aegypti TaxID=7159 RepID=Q177N6_AEDAE|nr:AAEL006088-PA [Aedes aegypti]